MFIYYGYQGLMFPRLINLNSVEIFGKGSFNSSFSFASSSFNFFRSAFLSSSIDTTNLSFSFVISLCTEYLVYDNRR